jgi:hypothetical protein
LYFQGYQQRVGVDDYIQLLVQELRVTPEDAEEAQEGAAWEKLMREKKERRDKAAQEQEAQAEAIRRAEASEERQRKKETDRYVFTHLQRRAHFKIRMRELEERAQRLHKESYFIDANRTELSILMKRLQLRLILLNQERDRVRGFTGTMVNSSVLHGAEMKYEIYSFKRDLDKARDDCASEIASSKFKVIAGEDRKAAIKHLIAEASARLSDRRAHFQHFMRTYERNAKLQNVVLVAGSMQEGDPQRDRLMRTTFGKIKTFVAYWQRVKLAVSNLIARKIRQFYYLALSKLSRRPLRPSNGRAESLSAGDIFLRKVQSKREEMQCQLREAIAATAQTKQRLELVGLPREPRNKMLQSSAYSLMEEGMDHAVLGKSTLPFLYEGDGMTRAAKFDAAKGLYEAQIISIRSRSIPSDFILGRRVMTPDDIKLLAFTHGRLGKLFALQNKLDRCLVEFDRQLSLAEEIDDDAEKADAYLGIGMAFLAKGELDEAVRYLDTSQGKYVVIGNLHRQSMALSALKECYERKHEVNSDSFYR